MLKNTSAQGGEAMFRAKLFHLLLTQHNKEQVQVGVKLAGESWVSYMSSAVLLFAYSFQVLPSSKSIKIRE